MSLFECPNCKKYYQLSINHVKYISHMCDSVDSFGLAIVECACGAKHVSGGESYTDGYDKGVMCFGRKYEEADDKKLLSFPAVMLEECDELDINKTNSTYNSSHFMDPGGRTIHLRPVQLKKGIERAMELREELFKIANSFGGDTTGVVAVILHGACNSIVKAGRLLNSITFIKDSNGE